MVLGDLGCKSPGGLYQSCQNYHRTIGGSGHHCVKCGRFKINLSSITAGTNRCWQRVGPKSPGSQTWMPQPMKTGIGYAGPSMNWCGISRLINLTPVLVYQRQEQHVALQRGSSHVQRKRRGWCVSDDLLHSSK